MTNLSRRSFLRRSAIVLAGGLLVGDQALEMLEKLTHKKVFASVDLRTPVSQSEIDKMLRYQSQQAIKAMSQRIGEQMYGVHEINLQLAQAPFVVPQRLVFA